MKFTTEMIYADIGFGLWAAGALFLRQTGEVFVKSGNRRIAAVGLLAAVPAAALVYEGAAKATGTDPSSTKCLRAWTAAITTSALLDGVTFAAFPQILALSPQGMTFAGAAALWTTGACGAYGLWRTYDAKWE